MNREHALEIGRRLLDEHGLEKWTCELRYDPSACLGDCNPKVRRLRLDVFAAEVMDESEVRGVWLHEIAHALTDGHGHDDHWKGTCKRIGGIAEPGYTPKQIEALYMQCHHMLGEILADGIAQASNVYSPFAVQRDAVRANHALRLVMAGYKALTLGQSNAQAAAASGLSVANVAAIRAWDTMYRRKLRTGTHRRSLQAQRGADGGNTTNAPEPTVHETNQPKATMSDKKQEFDWHEAVARHAHDCESAVRRRARRHGYRVRKVRERDSYGPMMLIDAYNTVVMWCLDDWAEVAAALEREICPAEDGASAVDGGG